MADGLATGFFENPIHSQLWLSSWHTGCVALGPHLSAGKMGVVYYICGACALAIWVDQSAANASTKTKAGVFVQSVCVLLCRFRSQTTQRDGHQQKNLAKRRTELFARFIATIANHRGAEGDLCTEIPKPRTAQPSAMKQNTHWHDKSALVRHMPSQMVDIHLLEHQASVSGSRLCAIATVN